MAGSCSSFFPHLEAILELCDSWDFLREKGVWLLRFWTFISKIVKQFSDVILQPNSKRSWWNGIGNRTNHSGIKFHCSKKKASFEFSLSLCLVWVYLIKNRVIVWKWRSVETFICAAPVFRVSRFQFYSIFMWKLNSIVFVGRRRHPFKLRLQNWRYGFIIVLRLHSDSQIYILLRRESRSQCGNYAILLSSPSYF